MEVIGTALAVIGGLVILYGGITFLLAAFQEGFLWGLGCIFIPLVPLAFLLMHWDRAGKPFLIQLAGAVPLLLGGSMMES